MHDMRATHDPTFQALTPLLTTVRIIQRVIPELPKLAQQPSQLQAVFFTLSC
jgi:hypothetical protein